MIIAIHAKANSGKSEAAATIVRELGAVEVSLADPIKRIAQDLFDFTDEQLFGPSEFRNIEDTRYPLPDSARFAFCIDRDVVGHVHGPECGDPIYLTPRKVCQELGEKAREWDENVWVRRAMRLASRHAIAVIPDVRYPNEMQAIQRLGGRVIRIRRPGAGLSGAAGQHISETALAHVPDSAFDAVIHNDDSLEVFRARTIVAVMSLMPARAA